MLVLTRKKDESLIIGDGIEVKVLDVKGEMIKIGISAPASVPIYRKHGCLSGRYNKKDFS